METDNQFNSTVDMTSEQFRELGYRAVDMIAEKLNSLQSRSEPARRSVPRQLVEQILQQPLPEQGCSPTELLDYIEESVFPYSLGNINPRFFAWINSPAAPISVIGEFLAASMNTSAAGGDQASTYLEHAVLNWLKEIMGFPRSSGGLLVSGGSLATLVGLAVMRHCKFGNGEVSKHGLQHADQTMVVYKSAEGHSCIDKAVGLLGIGQQWLRQIPVDQQLRMDVSQLADQISQDRRAGLQPVCVVANAGTVNTGAVDPFDSIADLCQRENLWLHIDGAYGAVGVLAEQTEHLYRGMQRADSLGLDPHKWMYVPVECGCVLVKDSDAMRSAFSQLPPYLRDDRQLPWFSEFGPQQTRGFRALKLWLAMKYLGVEGYRELISRDISLARLLQHKIPQRRHFELLAAGPLSISCLRYAPPGVTDLDALNRAILDRVQTQGLTYLTSTEINGQLALRVAIVNFRTTESDLDFLLDTLEQAAKHIAVQ